MNDISRDDLWINYSITLRMDSQCSLWLISRWAIRGTPGDQPWKNWDPTKKEWKPARGWGSYNGIIFGHKWVSEQDAYEEIMRSIKNGAIGKYLAPDFNTVREEAGSVWNKDVNIYESSRTKS